MPLALNPAIVDCFIKTDECCCVQDPSPAFPEVTLFCMTEDCWTVVSCLIMPALDVWGTRGRHEAIKLLHSER